MNSPSKIIFKKSIYKLLSLTPKSLYLEAFYALYRNSCLREKGWFESFILKESINLSRKPIPWYTYPAIDFLEKRLTKEMKVFEYGCGNSTRWYADKVNSVTSVEHDPKWFEIVSQDLPKNVKLIRQDLEDQQYASEITRTQEKFDVVVIDGRDRFASTRFSISCLKENGILVFDNSERPKYQEAFAFLENQGYKKLDFVGMGPINCYEWATSIIYKNQNCIGL